MLRFAREALVVTIVALISAIPSTVAFVSSRATSLHFVNPSPGSTTKRSSQATDESIDWDSVKAQVIEEAKEIYECSKLTFEPYFQSDDSVTAQDIVQICDELDQEATMMATSDLVSRKRLQLRRRALEARRYELLAKLMRQDYDAYVATASFLSPSRIPRDQLPNVQDVPFPKTNKQNQKEMLTDEDGLPLVADCEIQDMVYNDSPLDKLLLDIFRKLVTQNTGGVTSEKPGILGLVEQGRTFMIQPGQTPEAQHKMVSDTLGGLMTPALPPFYRIFMSGIVPTFGENDAADKKPVQLGPWFYAPWLTSVVTPTFFAFLVGPSRPNRRKDGHRGGLLVEKCKFLQESGCKGLCLHQCKLPAQQFFDSQLGLPLTVSPNFETQECQWSFGEKPLPPDQDPSFPKGCLVGCESRRLVAGTKADLCSA